MKYFKFAKCLSGGLKLIEISNDVLFSSEKTIVLSEENLLTYKADVYFLCDVESGRYLKTVKKVKTGKTFLKFFNENKQ